jgi:hypothetical protein
LAHGLISSIHVLPLSLIIVFTTLRIQLELPHLLVTCLTHCVCTHLIDLLGIHLLQCSCGNEHIGTHDTFHDVLHPLQRNLVFHVIQEQLHVLFSPTLQTARCNANVVLSKDGSKTLAKIVIANPTHVDFLDLAFFTQGFARSKVVETKEQSYKITTLQNHFLSLAIDIFDYLHKQFDIFYNFVPTMCGE